MSKQPPWYNTGIHSIRVTKHILKYVLLSMVVLIRKSPIGDVIELSETSFYKDTTYQDRVMGTRKIVEESWDVSENNTTETVLHLDEKFPVNTVITCISFSFF